MIIQSLYDFKSPLLQLSHITEDHLKYFVNKRYINSLQQFAKLSFNEQKCKKRFRNATDEASLKIISSSIV